MIPKIYNIQIITPIFGGGVKANENDPVTPIRPSSIRGHLRFWWRATSGAKYPNVAELRQREGEIWGTTKNPSPVGIEVNVESNDEPFECARYEERHGREGYNLIWSKPLDSRNSSLPYALFPFQGIAPDKRDSKDPSKMIKSARFSLIALVPNQERMSRFQSEYNNQRNKKGLPILKEVDNNIQKDIESAIWAWVNFGGIGSRTRRGCGALYCIQSNLLNQNITPPSLKDFQNWWAERISYYDISSFMTPRKWTTLGRIYLKDGRDSISCWEACISVMKKFRQGVGIGRDLGKGPRPGRSRWPEPESLRNLISAQKGLKNRPSKWHPPDRRITDIAFPRAEFGMPIIIEIRGEDIKPTLQPNKDHDRMASSLILRPIKFGDNRFASMIIRLSTEPLQSAYVQPGKNDLVSGHIITDSQIRDKRNVDSPISVFCGTGSAVDAFITFVGDKGNDFEEVIL